ncbi:hypothetical protein ACVWZV_009722 [Bradyrhizobium sp. GM5.1]
MSTTCGATSSRQTRPLRELPGKRIVRAIQPVPGGCKMLNFDLANCTIKSRRSRSSSRITMAMLCIASTLLFATEGKAQCTARDGLQKQLKLRTPLTASMPHIVVKSAFDVPVWRTIAVGTFSDPFALSNALDAVGCGIGRSAGEVLARPSFSLSAARANVELFAVSAAELGFQTDTVSLADIYARAQGLGFGLVAAEVGPQLRLQYFGQPIGEFLILGMEPIRTWKGEPVILTVANGGAGLILIGQDGSADAQISIISRFLFVRSIEAAPANGEGQAPLVVHR